MENDYEDIQNDIDSFYDRILKGEETAKDLEYFYVLCDCYSDEYKDLHGCRPRSEATMCVNGYSGHPDIEGYRNLLKMGVNPFKSLDDAYERERKHWEAEEEREFFDTNPSGEEIVKAYPDYKKYFTDDDFNDIYKSSDED